MDRFNRNIAIALLVLSCYGAEQPSNPINESTNGSQLTDKMLQSDRPGDQANPSINSMRSMDFLSLLEPIYPSDAAQISIPAGPFLMGSEKGASDERPIHQLYVRAFKIDRYEITNGRYRICVEKGACSPPALNSSHNRRHYFDDSKYNDYPVILVSWSQAENFCRFAGGRLPSEAEWEKAARGPAPSAREYPWGDEAPDCSRANFSGKSPCVGDTDLVGQRPAGASPYGVLDMAGNVWEWVNDWYDSRYYSASPSQDPSGPANGNLKIMRGGCWASGASSLRVSCRKPELPNAWADNVGFRCAYDEVVK